MTRDDILKLEAGRELDQLVIDKVMRPDIGMMSADGFRPSRNISQAWDVVERMVSIGFRYELRGGWKGDKEHVAMFDIADWADGNPLYKAYADALSLAICRAALLAVLESRTK